MVNIANKIQSNFASGELAPSLWSRYDIQKYQSGLKTCKNFLLQVSGGINNRTGTKFIAKAKYNNKNVELVAFNVSITENYEIEFGDYYCRFYKDKQQLQISDANNWITSTDYLVGNYVKEGSSIYYCLVEHTSGVFATDLASGKWILKTTVGVDVPYEIPTPFPDTEIQYIKYIQSADVLFIIYPNYPTYELSRYGDTEWTIEKFEYDIPPFMATNQVPDWYLKVDAVFGITNLHSTKNLFNNDLIGSYFKIYHDIDGQSVVKDWSSIDVPSASIRCKGTWRFKTIGLRIDAELVIEKSINNGTNWTTIRTFVIEDEEIDTFGVEDEYCLIRIRFKIFKLGGNVKTILTSDPFTKFGIFKINSVTNPQLAVGEVITQFASTENSNDWAESAWSIFRGFPNTLTFKEERLVFAGTKTQPQTIWMSKTGDYYNFDVSDIIQDTDSISINLVSRKLNGINNLILLDNIIAFTSSGEWKVGSSDGGAITPTNIYASLQGQRGCSNVSPIIIGNKIIYIQPSGTVIRDLGFDYDSNSYTGSNLSLLSDHLFKNHTITGLDYKQEPNSTIYMVRNDGALITMTYLKEEEILGFARHDTNGTFENISVLKTLETEQVWAVILRYGEKFIEVFEDTYTDIEDQWYLDCALKYEGVPTTVITGLDHLNEREVYVLGNGNVIKTLDDIAGTPLIVHDGSLTLPDTDAVTKAIVGLAYSSEMITLDIEFNGELQNKKTKTPSLILNFENSRDGKVGDASLPDKYLENIAYDREFYDKGLPLFTGKYKLNITSFWDIGKSIRYIQDEPLPANILSIIVNTNIGG